MARPAGKGGSIPFSLQVEPHSGIIIATCSGSLGLEDAKEGAQAIWKQPEFNGQPVVWDFRSARLDFLAVDVGAVARFILEHQPSKPPSKVAFVTANTVDFGLARMFEALRKHPSTDVRVFRDFDDAVSWAKSDRIRAT
jgi:hypothetical protein